MGSNNTAVRKGPLTLTLTLTHSLLSSDDARINPTNHGPGWRLP